VVPGQPGLRSVDSECQSRVTEPRKTDCTREPSSWFERGPRRHVVMAWRVGPAGVGEQGRGTVGFPRNVGDPVVSTLDPERGNRSRAQKPLARGVARHAAGSEASVPGGYRQAKATKRGGMGDRES